MFSNTGCSGDDLVSRSDNAECSAPVGHKCLMVNDAAYVVFNETTAMYHVKGFSHCLNGSAIRVCKSDGYWDGEEPLLQRGRTFASAEILFERYLI